MKKRRNQYQSFLIFLKYISISLLSFLIDVTFFVLFNTYLKLSELLATIMARCLSSPINFFLNKKRVFKSETPSCQAFMKYAFLVIIQMLISGLLVEEICNFVPFNAVFIKIPIEIILFISNFLIQKFFIFSK